MQDINMQGAGPSKDGSLTTSERIDNLAVQFGHINLEEATNSHWFNNLAQPMPSSSDALPTTTPRSAETDQKESKFTTNLKIVSELPEVPVSGAAKSVLVDEFRQLAASVATIIAAVSASRLSFDSDLQFWAAVGLKMELNGFERLNPAHEYRQEYKKVREEALEIYGDIAEERGRFKEVNFPKKVRTQGQEDERQEKMKRRKQEKKERAGAPAGTGRSARLRRRAEKRRDRNGVKYNMHEMEEVLDEIDGGVPLP